MRAERGERAPGAQRRPAAVRRTSSAPAAPHAGRLPNPRLTGLGSGLFCGLVMFLLGGLCAVLFGASLTAYGVLFLPVCVLTAVWVRRGDLMIAPVVVPIAFAVGLLPMADGDGGTGGRLMGLVTALATQAGWLYGGTLVAGLIVIVRRIRLMHRRRTAAAGARPPV
ncbi:membrane protein [Streptomyces violaceus]